MVSLVFYSSRTSFGQVNRINLITATIEQSIATKLADIIFSVSESVFSTLLVAEKLRFRKAT